MQANWNAKRRTEDMPITEDLQARTQEMQIRRDLTFLYQEAAFHSGIPLYSVVDLTLQDSDKAGTAIAKELMPEAKSFLIFGFPINDPWFRIDHLVPGESMEKINSIVGSKVEIYLLQFREKLETMGYKTELVPLPLTPNASLNPLFDLSDHCFIGKNNLLHIQSNGCRVQLGGILTDAPLMDNDYRYEKYNQVLCGDCTLCEESCPAGALKDGAYDEKLCQAFRDNPDNQLQFSEYSWYKCDLCMRACPTGASPAWDEQKVQISDILEKKTLTF